MNRLARAPKDAAVTPVSERLSQPPSKIAICGEAWGAEEAKQRSPFVGYSGNFFTKMLHDAGINRADCFLTNVFNIQPPGNDELWFFGDKATGIEGYPPLTGAKFVQAKFINEFNRLADEIAEFDPNIIICAGNVAMWAFTGKTGIGKWRGVTYLSTLTASGFKVLPTYHPMGVIHQMPLRPTVVLDLQKALRESEFPDLRRPKREIWIEPTLSDLEEFYERYIRGCPMVAVDIETTGNQITCVGLAVSSVCAIVIPFYDRRRKSRSYWEDEESERKAWGFVNRVLVDRTNHKVFQNGLYDIAFLYRSMGIKVYGAEHDTMLLHHALQPEALKSLGFLGSIYTDEGAWKQMRERTTTTIKRDE